MTEEMVGDSPVDSDPLASQPSQDEMKTTSSMFKIVPSVLDCSSSNLFGCFEDIFLTIAVAAAIYYAQIAVRRILKDRNEILELWEKIVVVIAFCELLLLFMIFGIHNAHVWEVTIRSLLFASTIFICEYVFEHYPMEESARLKALKALRLSFAYVFALWFFCGFLHKNIKEAPYNCLRVDWILISGSNLIVSCIQSYMSLSIIQVIQERQQQQQQESTPTPNYAASQLNVKGSDERKRIQLTWLMIGTFVPTFSQFFWDYVARTHSFDPTDCNAYFFSQSFGTMLIFLILKGICYFGSPAAVFFVFYWQNQADINTVNENPNGQFFYDRRSEVIEKYSF